MTPERPFREWPLEQLAEQAMLHPADAGLLGALAAEAGCRPGARAKAVAARIGGLIVEISARSRRAEEARLRGTLAAAAEEIARLRQRLAARDAAGTDPGPYRRVHLTPDAPAWLVAEVRRAFRRRYHPDGQADPGRRRRSEEVFKRIEAVFAEIERLRGK
jgi:hypothetical protein